AMRYVFAELSAQTGDRLDGVRARRRVAPIARYWFADGSRLDATTDLSRFCARLDRAFGSGAGDDWWRLAERAERIWRAVREPFLESTVDNAATLLRRATPLRDLGTVAPGRSLRQLRVPYLPDPPPPLVLAPDATSTRPPPP